MSELDWQSLRVKLLAGGVAPKYVRRTIIELRAHFRDLQKQATKEGLSASEAVARARSEIGDEATLLKEVLSKPELRSIQAKFPRAFFLLSPLLALFASFALVLGSILFLASSAGWLGGLEAGTELASWRKSVIELWFMANCYLVTPFLALATVAVAKRRAVEPFWPVIGIVLLTVIGSGWAYGITWPTAEGTGSFKLNWGFSFLPRVVRGGHDMQNHLQIFFTLAAAAIFWRLYDPLNTELSDTASN